MLPSKNDPRLHLALVITTVQILGQVVFDFDLSIAQILVSVGVCAVLEVAITLGQRRQLVWPASAMLTGNGVALILRVPGTEHGDWWSTRGWWAFGSIAGFSLLSKYVIRWHGRHIFNPSNFGLVVGVVAFRALPIGRMNELQVDLQDLWWGPMSIGLVVTVAVIGLGFAVVTRRLGLLGMAFTFWGTFAASTAVVAASGHCIMARWHIGPLCDWQLWRVLVFSPEVLIFLAFMITDPKTTPSARIQRIAFGGMVGVLAALLLAPQETELRVKLAILASLIIGCAARPLIERWVPDETRTLAGGSPWLGDTRRRLVLGSGFASGSVVVLLLAAGLSGVDMPVRPAGADASADQPESIALKDLPPVVVDSSVSSLSPPMDETRAKELALDVLNALQLERRAVHDGDADLASRVAAGPRLQKLEEVISRGAKVKLASYDFDRMTVLMNRPNPQSPPVLSVQAEGNRQIGKQAERVIETFQVVPAGGHFLIAAPDPVLDDETPGETSAESESDPPIVPPVIPDGWLDPAALHGLKFTDVTKVTGLDAPQAGPVETPRGSNFFAGGAAAEDYDLDGDVDLYLPRTALANLLYRNNGDGTFTDVAGAAGVEGPSDGSGDGAPIWGDIDGDGDLDLLVTSASGPRVVLFVNQGDGTFNEEAKDRGIDISTERSDGLTSYGAAFGDIDNDGDLDLVTTQWNVDSLIPSVSGTCDGEPTSLAESGRRSQSRLLLNNGDGDFGDVTSAWGLDLDKVFAFQPTFADYDADGWPDLFLTGDFCTSRVFRNLEGGGFADVTDALGVGSDENGMGSVVADVNGDGLLDWLITSVSYPTADGTCPLGFGCSGNRLYLNTGGSLFKEATDLYGLRDGYWGWGAAITDLNHDGNSDVLQTNGSKNESYFAHDPTTVWINSGKPPFARATKRTGIVETDLGKAVVAFDYDSDGDVDVLVVNTEGPPRLWRNDLPSNPDWVQVRLADYAGRDPRGVGARVEVDLGKGEGVRVGEVRAGGSFQSQDSTTLNFGLGDAATQASVPVRVFWPGAEEPQVEQVAPGTLVTIKRT